MLTNNIKNITHHFYPYAFWDNFFTDKELSEIEIYCDDIGFEKGFIGTGKNNSRIDESVRKSKIKFHHYNKENAWIFEKFKAIVEHTNREFYNFDLYGFDHFHYTVYDEVGSKYTTHVDIMYGNDIGIDTIIQRKLSFSILLTDPAEYEGGQLEILINGKDATTIESKRGRVILFPSFVPHRVTPITSGVRKSIVIWAVGPRFR